MIVVDELIADELQDQDRCCMLMAAVGADKKALIVAPADASSLLPLPTSRASRPLVTA